MKDYAIIGMLLSGMGLLAAYMYLASRVHYLIKITLAITVVVLAVYTSWAMQDLYGYPVPSVPRDGSVILALDIDKPHNVIAFWVEEEHQPRSYAVPYDPALARMLLDAAARAHDAHGRMVFHLHGGDRHGFFGFFEDTSELDINIDVVGTLPPKENK